MLGNLEIGGGHSCGVEIMALRAKIIVVLRTEIIVSADSGDSPDSGDSSDSGDSADSVTQLTQGGGTVFVFFHGWQYVKGLLC